MIWNGSYVGNAKAISQLTMSPFEIIAFLFINIAGYIVLYFLYISTRNKKPIFKFIPSQFAFNKQRFHIFIFILIISNLLFTLYTGVGIINSKATSEYSFIFAYFKVESIFLFYYFLGRQNKKIYILNLLLYAIYQLYSGWTGFLFYYAIFELYFYFKYKKKWNKISIIKSFMYSGVLFFIGGKFYQYFYQIKFYQRLGSWGYELTYFEGVSALVSRLSYFPLSVSVFQHIDMIKHLYGFDGVLLKEVFALFRPLVPSFIMADKMFRTINNVVVQAIHFDIKISTSSNVGIVSYASALFYSDIFAGIFWVLIHIILFIIISSVINACEQYKGQLNMIYFILLLNIYNVCALEQVYSYGFLSLFYLYPFLRFFKVCYPSGSGKLL
jgi:hypothetical protein